MTKNSPKLQRKTKIHLITACLAVAIIAVIATLFAIFWDTTDEETQPSPSESETLVEGSDFEPGERPLLQLFENFTESEEVVEFSIEDGVIVSSDGLQFYSLSDDSPTFVKNTTQCSPVDTESICPIATTSGEKEYGVFGLTNIASSRIFEAPSRFEQISFDYGTLAMVSVDIDEENTIQVAVLTFDGTTGIMIVPNNDDVTDEDFVDFVQQLAIEETTVDEEEM